MPFSRLEERWFDIVDAIRVRWPATDLATLRSFAGDAGKFARYLADVHDLTLREATEAFEDWLRFFAPIPQRA